MKKFLGYGSAALVGALLFGGTAAAVKHDADSLGPTSEAAEHAPGDEPVASCGFHFLGGSSSCKTPATWKKHAYDDCKKGGQSLFWYSPVNACSSSSYRGVWYQCC